MLFLTLTPKDNAWHNQIVPCYIEWWYLDMQSVAGDHISGSFAIWGNLDRPTSCIVRSDFIFSFSDGRVIDFSKQVSLDNFHARNDFCDVHLGDEFFKDMGNEFALHLERFGEAILDLSITPTCAGFGYRYDFDKDQYFYWIVPVPQGSVTGKIQYGGNTYSFDGTCYHDHNWASVSLSEKIQSWKWGRCLDADLTLIFATVADKHKTLFQGVAVMQQSKIGIEYKYLMFSEDKPLVNIQETPNGWVLLIIDTGIELKMDIVKNHLVLERDENGIYQRFASHISGSLFVSDIKRRLNGVMIHEFKNLNRETI